MHNQAENMHFLEQMQMKNQIKTEGLCISYIFCKLRDDRAYYTVSILSTWDMQGNQV